MGNTTPPCFFPMGEAGALGTRRRAAQPPVRPALLAMSALIQYGFLRV